MMSAKVGRAEISDHDIKKVGVFTPLHLKKYCVPISLHASREKSPPPPRRNTIRYENGRGPEDEDSSLVCDEKDCFIVRISLRLKHGVTAKNRFTYPTRLTRQTA